MIVIDPKSMHVVQETLFTGGFQLHKRVTYADPTDSDSDSDTECSQNKDLDKIAEKEREKKDTVEEGTNGEKYYRWIVGRPEPRAIPHESSLFLQILSNSLTWSESDHATDSVVSPRASHSRSKGKPDIDHFID